MSENVSELPCDTCGWRLRFIGGKRCRLCWEVESRLAEYVQSERGRRKLLDALGAASTASFEAIRQGLRS